MRKGENKGRTAAFLPLRPVLFDKKFLDLNDLNALNALNALSRIRTDLVRIRRGGRGVALKKSPLRGGFAYSPASSDETPVPA